MAEPSARQVSGGFTEGSLGWPPVPSAAPCQAAPSPQSWWNSVASHTCWNRKAAALLGAVFHSSLLSGTQPGERVYSALAADWGARALGQLTSQSTWHSHLKSPQPHSQCPAGPALQGAGTKGSLYPAPCLRDAQGSLHLYLLALQYFAMTGGMLGQCILC